MDEELEDPRSQAAPLPLHTFSFPLTEARYIRFLLLSWYGYGSGGLQYFAPVLTFLGMLYKEGTVPKKEDNRRSHHSEPYYAPTHAGGLFAINREWFKELGWYDPGKLNNF